jgi:hypothetical protein
MTHAGLPRGICGFVGDGVLEHFGFQKKIRGKIDWPCKRNFEEKIIINY